jgi:hypothetical protein
MARAKYYIKKADSKESDTIFVTTQLTCSDASKIIGGLLSLIKCNRFVAHGCKVSNSPMFLKALDDVFDTIDKYQQQA